MSTTTTRARRPDAGDLSRWLTASRQGSQCAAELCNIPAEYVDGQHRPCPFCGGTDRFRFFDDGSGGGICNQCDSDGKNPADAIAMVQKRLGISFNDAYGKVLEWATSRGFHPPGRNAAVTANAPKAGNSPAAGSPPTSSKVSEGIEKLSLRPFDKTDNFHVAAIRLFANSKPGIVPATIARAGIFVGRWYNGRVILGMPGYQTAAAAKAEKPGAVILYLASGQRFPAFKNLAERKTHLLMDKGSKDSWFIVGGISALKKAKVVVKCEGASDALAVASILPPEFAAVSNALGASPRWDGRSAPDFGIFKSRDVLVIPDQDDSQVGQRSGQAFAEMAAKTADAVYRIDLPAGVKDVRDWVAAGNGWAEFEDLFAAAEEIQETAMTSVQPGEGIAAEPENATGLTERPLTAEDQTDIGNARHFAHRNEQRLRYCFPWKKWLAWDGSRWIADADRAALRLAKDTIEELFTLAAMAKDKETFAFALASSRLPRIEAMMKLAAPEMAISPAELDQNNWLLNCMNGTVDLRTGKLREHYREDYLTKRCPTDFDQAAEAPIFRRFVSQLFADDAATIEFIQRLSGYFLTGNVQEQVLSVCHGSGSNGKSTFLNCLQSVLGSEFATNAPSDFLIEKHGDQHPTEQADLFGRRLVICAETGQSKRLAEPLVKALTGGERIRARRMREDFWEFEPTHKLILMTNHRPIIRGSDHGIWRRLLLIPFAERFEGDRKDPELPDKLRAERSGILTWMVEGCLQWQREGLNPPESVRVATDEYRNSEDVVGRFVEACCMKGSLCEVRFKAFYDRFENWCEETGDYCPPRRAVGIWLSDNGFEKYSSNGTIYRGIQLIPDSFREEF